MAKVSLRIYNREIEQLIEQGQIDEAIAHCRHILKTFPKHLETYRVLGKAYLEARRYNEVIDVFSRLLMVVPDDFVAHVGLSIIRDEDNKLDDAIWHMERAFEAQPSNPAIQGELQRLYGRRDGMDPPKIRMTRGALARVYVQGELYPQAITEIRSVLAEDPQRTDMQVLLAYSYFKSGQKADASDLCNQLLKRAPYCFDANRIMVDLLPATTGTAESTQVYRMRVGELDPYANFTRGSIFQTADVPDASISLERLEYSGEESEGWDSSALGIGLGAAAAAGASNWLPSGETPQDSPLAGAATPAGDEIPDFLRAAGWGESSGPEQPSSIFDEEVSAASDLTPADLPDWLKEQSPEPSAISPASEPRPESIETPDWLTGLEEQEQAAPSLSEAEAQPADVPDWLSGLGEAESETPAETPDWLSGLDNETSEPAESPQEELAQPADIPDWLKGVEPASEPVASVADLGSSAQEQDDAVAWLESLAAKHGAKPEELVTDPSKRSETPPEWVAQAQSAGEAKPSAADLGASAQEQDDAVAWLESLAAKHGAKPEELVTDPSKRSETPPEWVTQAQSIGEAQLPAEEPAASEWVEGAQNVGEQFFAEFEQGSSASSVDETGMWLRDLEENKPAEEASDWMLSSDDEKPEGGDIPEWLSETPQPADDTQKVSSEDVMANNDLSDWLNTLDDEPGLPLDPSLLQASQRPPFPSEPAPELPNWLADEQAETPVEEIAWEEPAASAVDVEPESPAETPISLEADLPEWLKGVEDESVAEEETPPQQPTPTSPSDWHPVVETQPAKEKPAPKERLVVQQPPSPEPVEKKKKESARQAAARPARKAESAQSGVGLLNQAQSELDRGDIPEALLHYGKLIKKGKHLEETITHLSDSLYRYPVEVGIWQALGDAYMRANRLKEALDAYNKAEELIR